jgi:hypothetical protein
MAAPWPDRPAALLAHAPRNGPDEAARIILVLWQDKKMDAEQLNQIAATLSDLHARLNELRRYL